ncbi:hypothetical protein HNR34_003636 [Geobacillus subterraneus]
MPTITLNIGFFPHHPQLLRQLGEEYIRVVNELTEQMEHQKSFPKLTTKHVNANLPSAVLNQAIRDARSVFKKMKKQGNVQFSKSGFILSIIKTIPLAKISSLCLLCKMGE